MAAIGDFFNFPSKYTEDVQIYTVNTAVNLNGFQQWNKPKGCTFVYMICIGGGGGGGGGTTRAAGNAGGGGGGGACSGITRFTIPAMFLPDIMFVQVGDGGQGGIAGGNGGAGINSYILTSKVAVLPNIICYANTGPPGGGGGGTSGAGGGGGSVPVIAVTQPLNSVGEWFSTVGIIGAIGGSQTGGNGTAITAWGSSIPLSPGSGGGGTTSGNFNGGAQTATALLDVGNQLYVPAGGGNLVLGGTSGSAPGAGGDGGGGLRRITPLFNCGGSGGAGNNTIAGGNGGSGGYGCGGGGGGAGTTGGSGGNGGSGLVVIIAM